MKGVEMLCLSRKTGQRIIIGDELVILTVTEIGRDGESGGFYVKLGFDADPSLPIHREEVYLAIQRGKSQKNGLDTA